MWENDDLQEQSRLQNEDFTCYGRIRVLDIVKRGMSQKRKDPLLCNIFVWQVSGFFGYVVFRHVSIIGRVLHSIRKIIKWTSFT